MTPQAPGTLLSPVQDTGMSYCPVVSRRPRNPEQYRAAYHAAVGTDPAPYNPVDPVMSPVQELDASKVKKGMRIWLPSRSSSCEGRFMMVELVRPYEGNTSPLVSARVPEGSVQLDLCGDDGSTAWRALEGDWPVYRLLR